jgi:hypothetical protein
MFCPAKRLPSHLTKESPGEIKFKPGTREIDTASLQNLKWAAQLGSKARNVTVSQGKFSSAQTTRIRVTHGMWVIGASCYAWTKKAESYYGSWLFRSSLPVR